MNVTERNANFFSKKEIEVMLSRSRGLTLDKRSELRKVNLFPTPSSTYEYAVKSPDNGAESEWHLTDATFQKNKKHQQGTYTNR
jgi:hypothetical protein